MARGKRGSPKWIEVSNYDTHRESLGPGQDYHDLGSSYPDAPVPRIVGDTVIRRAELQDLTGISEIMNWVSDGDIVIVKMGRIINNDLELNVAVNKIQRFVDDDISGEVLRLGEKRLLLLPSSFSNGNLEYDGGIITISNSSSFGLSVTKIVSGVDTTIFHAS